MRGSDLAEAMASAVDRIVSARCRVILRPRVEGQDHGDLGPGRERERGRERESERERERETKLVYINIYRIYRDLYNAAQSPPSPSG